MPMRQAVRQRANASRMFDISFAELTLAAVVALLVLGPERLPGALRSLGLTLGRMRRAYYNVKSEVEREIGMDEVRRQLHNEQIMEDVKRVQQEVKAIGQEARIDPAIPKPEAAAPSASADSQGETDSSAVAKS